MTIFISQDEFLRAGLKTSKTVTAQIQTDAVIKVKQPITLICQSQITMIQCFPSLAYQGIYGINLVDHKLTKSNLYIKNCEVFVKDSFTLLLHFICRKNFDLILRLCWWSWFLFCSTSTSFTMSSFHRLARTNCSVINKIRKIVNTFIISVTKTNEPNINEHIPLIITKLKNAYLIFIKKKKKKKSTTQRVNLFK